MVKRFTDIVKKTCTACCLFICTEFCCHKSCNVTYFKTVAKYACLLYTSDAADEL